MHLTFQNPVLNIYNAQYETELHTMQKSPEDGQYHPGHYMSKKTTDAERKYTSYELEVFAVVKATEKFRIYLLPIHFKIVSDCKVFT